MKRAPLEGNVYAYVKDGQEFDRNSFVYMLVRGATPNRYKILVLQRAPNHIWMFDWDQFSTDWPLMCLFTRSWNANQGRLSSSSVDRKTFLGTESVPGYRHIALGNLSSIVNNIGVK